MFVLLERLPDVCSGPSFRSSVELEVPPTPRRAEVVPSTLTLSTSSVSRSTCQASPGPRS